MEGDGTLPLGRLAVIPWVIVGAAVLLLIGFGRLQIIEKDYYDQLARQNSAWVVPLVTEEQRAALRGEEPRSSRSRNSSRRQIDDKRELSDQRIGRVGRRNDPRATRQSGQGLRPLVRRVRLALPKWMPWVR